MDPGRTNWSAPLGSSWAGREQRINSPGQEISLSGWIMENHNTPSLPPVWLGELFISQITSQPSPAFLGAGQQGTQPLKKHSLEQTWVQHCLRFRCYSLRALPLASAGTSAPCRAPGLSLWPSWCPRSQGLMLIKISIAAVDPFLFHPHT